ncbi:LacI family DNA-binding transcriptional regulator [Sphingobacterium gobiense]|uniref:LacI family DNA-binding transcriptional regulator n=1 Tax=Sphingobacterium gobiense TaxID=1382456 RepID=UPI001FE7E478|nr:LacI family DNA-binding transcriptional regulator [Sphingobacterium gobiense]
MGKKTSITSIAKHLGISTTTISFVLNGKAQEKRISDQLVKKVLDYVEEIDYKPNALARSLRTGKSNTIALIVEDISFPFFSAIAKEIEAKAYKSGYKIIYSSTENDTAKTEELIEIYQEKHVDGYIIVPPTGIQAKIVELCASGKPVVVLDRYLEGVQTDYVLVNNDESVYSATKYLIDQGYKNIAFITLNSLQSQMLDRLSGYEKAILDNNLTPIIQKLTPAGRLEREKELLSFLEKKCSSIEAIVFSTNYICVGGLKAIKQLGLRIPEDIAVVSFDDYELFEMYSPAITSIAQPIEAISENAINLLLSRLGKKASEVSQNPQKIILSTTFVPRDSCTK